MTALHVKLRRDLWRLRAQVATIALVVACGVAGFVGMFSLHDSLQTSRDRYYAETRFADVFASVRRAPVALRERIAAIDGVADVKLDTAFDTQVDLPALVQPATGRFIGLDPTAPPGMNRLTLRAGRWPERGSVLEAVVNERFADVRGLKPGTLVHALLNGRRETVRIVGTALSPEYVFATRGGAPDDAWFGVFWVDAEQLATAFDMQGAFNRVALRLDPGAREAKVIAALDALLEPWGSVGAVARADQLSNRILDNELTQLHVLGTVLPSIFLAVAVFILNVVMSRQVATQRQQIATLKALGYGDPAIAWHYVQLALAIALAGIAVGGGGSLWLGTAMTRMYAAQFRFTTLAYATVPAVAAAAVLLVCAGAALGAAAAIRGVVRLSPAQAMLPPAPPVFRRTLLERLGWARGAGAAVMMVVRNVERRPLRALLTVLGIASAVALQISGAYWQDTIAHIVDVQWRQVQQGDVIVDFREPAAPEAVAELLRLPGVLEAEGWRSEPVRVRAHACSEDTVLSGYVPRPRLLRLVDEERGPLPMPEDGVVLNQLLARSLGVGIGDTVEVEFRLWHRRRATLRVVDLAHTMFGKQLFMSFEAMSRTAGDGRGINAAVLRVDPAAMEDFHAAVKAVPAIAAVSDKAGALRSFNETTATNLRFFTLVLTAFAVAMAVGITYNAARIALSERAWELASLRVLGMTRAEVSWLLLAELGVELLAALPLGAWLGHGLASGLMAMMRSQDIDFPVVVAPSTYGLAALCVLAAGAASALVVRRRIDRLDLVAVLKVRE